MTQIKLEVGKKYRNRRGEVVEIVSADGKYGYPFLDICGYSYLENGRHSVIEERESDLIEEVIEPAKEPVKKPHKHAELIKAWADGAEIEVWNTHVGNWLRFGNELAWAEYRECRIKPPEVPQWRKDMAQALKDGKVVEYYNLGKWIKTANTAEDFLDPELLFDREDYCRIKPQPNPDVETVLGKKGHGWTEFLPNPMLLNWDVRLKLIWDGETGKLKSAEVLK